MHAVSTPHHFSLPACVRDMDLHVLNCTTECVGGGVAIETLLAEPKVGENHMALAIKHDVLGLQIPANEIQQEVIQEVNQEVN